MFCGAVVTDKLFSSHSRPNHQSADLFSQKPTPHSIPEHKHQNMGVLYVLAQVLGNQPSCSNNVTISISSLGQRQRTSNLPFLKHTEVLETLLEKHCFQSDDFSPFGFCSLWGLAGSLKNQVCVSRVTQIKVAQPAEASVVYGKLLGSLFNFL